MSWNSVYRHLLTLATVELGIEEALIRFSLTVYASYLLSYTNKELVEQWEFLKIFLVLSPIADLVYPISLSPMLAFSPANLWS